MKFSVRSLCRVSAREVPRWAWGGGLDPPKTKCCSISPHIASQGPRIYDTVKVLVRSLCRVSAVGWPGWAGGGLCEVWWEGDNAKGSRPHEGGFAKKRTRNCSRFNWMLRHKVRHHIFCAQRTNIHSEIIGLDISALTFKRGFWALILVQKNSGQTLHKCCQKSTRPLVFGSLRVLYCSYTESRCKNIVFGGHSQPNSTFLR